MNNGYQIIRDDHPLIDIGPGIYHAIANEDYHSCPGLSSSALKLALRSSLHYADYYLWGGKEEDEDKMDSAALVMGTLFHSLVLEPERELDFIFVHDDLPDGRTKEGRAAKKALAEQVAKTGKQPISKTDFKTVQDMTARARKDPQIQAQFANGKAECSLFWIDDETGLLCKCRPDYWREDLQVLYDLKSALDADDDSCSKSTFNFAYFLSAAFYLDGVSKATGVKYQDFVFAFMEKKRPFATNMFLLDAEAVELGRMQYRKALIRIAAGVKTGYWPGYSDSIRPMGLPSWAKNKLRTNV